MSSIGSTFSYRPAQFVSAYETLRNEIILSPPTCTAAAPSDVAENMKSSSSKIVVAAVQMETLPTSEMGGSTPAKDFLDRALNAIEEAVATKKANLVLLQELFMGPYFCQSQEACMFALAESDIEKENALISMMQEVAKKFSVVLPISLFERKNNTFYNSVVMIDADGEILGTYSE